MSDKRIKRAQLERDNRRLRDANLALQERLRAAERRQANLEVQLARLGKARSSQGWWSELIRCADDLAGRIGLP